MYSGTPVVEAVAKEAVLSHIRDKHGHRISGILNLWSPLGLDGKLLLSTIQRMLRQEKFLDPVQVVEIEKGNLQVLAAMETPEIGVLLVNGLDQVVGTDSFYDVETLLSKRLDSSNAIIIVFTNMPAIPWEQNRLWKCTTNRQLGPLKREQVEIIARDGGFDPEDAWNATFGYAPVLQYWVDNPSMSEQEIAAEVFAASIGNSSRETQEIIALASLLPFFSVASLRAAKGSAGDEDEYDRLTDSIKDLISIGVIFWDMDSGWYRFTDGALRRLLARKMIAERGDEVAAVRARAWEYFCAEALRPTYLQYSLVSAVYFLALGSSVSQNEAGQLSLRWIERSLPGWQGADWYAVLQAWRKAGGDWHVEDELRQQIGDETYDSITRLIGMARESVR
jgi:hypothetical protein